MYSLLRTRELEKTYLNDSEKYLLSHTVKVAIYQYVEAIRTIIYRISYTLS